MIDQIEKPQFTILVPPKLLQEGYMVYFTDVWPSTLTAIRNKYFRIDVTNQVPYDLSYIIPTGDYKDVDLSNESDGEKLYPTGEKTLYEVTMGFKTGNFLAHLYIPQSKALSYLEYSGMTPDVTNSTKRYIGARKPEDSPYEDHRIKMYFVKDLSPLIMRLYCLPGVDYEKVVVGLMVNKCRLREVSVEQGTMTNEDKVKAKVIRYYDEQRW